MKKRLMLITYANSTLITHERAWWFYNDMSLERMSFVNSDNSPRGFVVNRKASKSGHILFEGIDGLNSVRIEIDGLMSLGHYEIRYGSGGVVTSTFNYEAIGPMIDVDECLEDECKGKMDESNSDNLRPRWDSLRS